MAVNAVQIAVQLQLVCYQVVRFFERGGIFDGRKGPRTLCPQAESCHTTVCLHMHYPVPPRQKPLNNSPLVWNTTVEIYKSISLKHYLQLVLTIFFKNCVCIELFGFQCQNEPKMGTVAHYFRHIRWMASTSSPHNHCLEGPPVFRSTRPFACPSFNHYKDPIFQSKTQQNE
jgi:hypothetical protein